MQLVLVELGLFATWLMLNFWILPQVRASWIAGDLRTKMMRAGVVAVLDKLTEFLLIGWSTLLAIIAIVALLGAWASTGALAPAEMIRAVASLKDGVKKFADAYGIFIGVTGLFGGGVMLWMAVKQARKRVADIWHDRAMAEYSAILDDLSLLEPIGQDPEWRPRVDEILHIVATLSGEALPDPDQRQLQQRLHSLLLMLAFDRAGQLTDIPELIGRTETPEDPPSGWRGVLAMLASKRFSEDLALIRKPLGKIVTALLFVSLVGWTAAPLADSLRLTVNNLRVNVDNADAQRNLQSALSQAEAPPQEANAPPVAPANATRILAKAIVRQMVRSPMLADAADAPQPARREGAAVTRAVLSDQVLLPAEPMAPATDVVRREAAAGAGEIGDGRVRNLHRAVEQRIAPAVEQLGRDNPRALKAAVAWAQARYAEPIVSGEAISRLTEALLDFGSNPAGFQAHNEIDRQAQKLGKSFGKKSLQIWIDARTQNLLADLIRRSARPVAARTLVLDLDNGGRSFVADLHRPPEKGWAPSAAVAEEQRVNSKVVDAIIGESGEDPSSPLSRRMGEVLGGYDSVFPSRAASGAAISEDVIIQGASAAGRFTDFGFASRSFRVRGVVIGRDLHGRLDLSDIRWKIVPARGGLPTRVAVDLQVRQTGAWQQAGTFDAGTINQAIRYAADGRVIAATIVPGDGKHIIHSIKLHPALIDTPLGCRMIESDRWVDQFTVGKGAPPVWQDRMATWDWLRQMERMEKAVGNGALCQALKLPDRLINSTMPAPRFSQGYAVALDQFLRSGLNKPTGSSAFVQAASMCAKLGGKAALECVCGGDRAAALRSLPDRYWFPEDHTSQLRERTTNLSPDLKWLTPSPERLGAFDMWVHTTFSLRDAGQGDETQTTAFDFPDARLRELRSLIRARLPAHLKRELQAPSYEDFMRPLEEFVLFQRLARAALQSKLGPEFPTPKLVALARATRRYVPAQPTIRWDAAGDRLTLLAFLGSADKGAAQRYRQYNADVDRRAKRHEPICAASSL